MKLLGGIDIAHRVDFSNKKSPYSIYVRKCKERG
jgi:hypothetical protein